MAANDWANWVTADQVRAYAEQVNGQIVALDGDFGAALREAPDASAPAHASINAWDAFYASWKGELATARGTSWLTFGLPAQAERIRGYQESAKAWQEKIAGFRGKPSGLPAIVVPPTSEVSPFVWAGAGALGVLFLALMVRR